MTRLAVAVVAVVALQQGAGAQFGFGDRSELKVVERFDRDGNGRLDTAERQAARQWLTTNAPDTGGFGRRRFGGSRSGAVPSSGQQMTPADVKSFGQASLYDDSILRTIFLRFENDDWSNELAAFYNTDVEVPATAIVDGRTYRDVGVHFRGASSYRMVGAEAKKSLNLSFDFAQREQRLLGYRTLNLLNGNGDSSFVRTLLYSRIAGRHNIPTPKANYVRVVINDENWGVYINAQQFNSDFTREWFKSASGARWKTPGSPRGRAGMQYLGEGVDRYRGLYEIKTKDDPKSWAALIQMFRVLNETPLEKLEAALAPMLDIDGVLKFLALEVVLVNSDGYWTRASDYNIYQDPRGRFHVIPHDINEALSEQYGFGGGGVNLDPLVSIDDESKPLRSRLLNVPALRARYLGYVREIAEQGLDWTTLEPVVRRYRAVIAADVKIDTRKLFTTEGFEAGPASVKSFADRRRAFLLQPLR